MNKKLSKNEGWADSSVSSIHRSRSIHTSYSTSSMDEAAGGKEGHSWDLLMRAHDSPLGVLTPAALEDYKSWGGSRGMDGGRFRLTEEASTQGTYTTDCVKSLVLIFLLFILAALSMCMLNTLQGFTLVQMNPSDTSTLPAC